MLCGAKFKFKIQWWFHSTWKKTGCEQFGRLYDNISLRNSVILTSLYLAPKTLAVKTTFGLIDATTSQKVGRSCLRFSYVAIWSYGCQIPNKIAYSLMFLIAMFDNIVHNSVNFLSLQKVPLEIHHATSTQSRESGPWRCFPNAYTWQQHG